MTKQATTVTTRPDEKNLTRFRRPRKPNIGPNGDTLILNLCLDKQQPVIQESLLVFLNSFCWFVCFLVLQFQTMFGFVITISLQPREKHLRQNAFGFEFDVPTCLSRKKVFVLLNRFFCATEFHDLEIF